MPDKYADNLRATRHFEKYPEGLGTKLLSRYIKYFETRTKHLLFGIKGWGGGVRFISYSSQTRLDTCSFLLRLLDSLVIGNICTKFEKTLSSRFFFQGNRLKFSELVLVRMALLMSASCSVLPLRSATLAREFGEFGR